MGLSFLNKDNSPAYIQIILNFGKRSYSIVKNKNLKGNHRLDEEMNDYDINIHFPRLEVHDVNRLGKNFIFKSFQFDLAKIDRLR